MPIPRTLDDLRLRVLQAALTRPVTLGRAIAAMGFVQADPIRVPARAQDLILRHRVTDYRAGDLERRYRRLGLDEDFLYAYGIMPPETARLLHPRPGPDAAKPYKPRGLAAEVLALVQTQGDTHPADLEAQFGRERATNAWGGFSKETTQVLHELHYHGLLRVVGRRNGIRLYGMPLQPNEPMAPEERLSRLLLLVLRILSPISERSLRGVFLLMRRGAPSLGNLWPGITRLLDSGALERCEIDGETYLWLTDAAPSDYDPTRGVRFLAPFDPIVWDRRRFEHLWGWAYRFEAYTPVERRELGYYALPLLWRDRIIGWVNASTAEGPLNVQVGFIGRAPKTQVFQRAFDAEVARLEAFLG
jgi:uncharacterized protein YcaQ